MSTISGLLLFDDERKAQLDLLNQIDESAALELCNAAINYLSSGIDKKALTSAAKSLQLDYEILHATIDSLLWLFTECGKAKISAEALDESLKFLAYSDRIRQEFIKSYQLKSNQIEQTLSNDLTLLLPRYKDLTWRFDVQIMTKNSRSRKQFDPFFILKLVLIDGCTGKERAHILQVDPLTLVHLVEQLESALNDLRNNHARRIIGTFR